MRWALLAFATLVLCGVTILWQVEPHDEGLMLAWAGRIASGQAPYRDFWCNYAPGQPLLLAGLVKLFGPSLLAWRVLRLVVDVAVALLAYVLIRRRAGEGWALAGWLATAGAMAFPAGPGPNATALALGLGAIALAPRRALIAGALAGLACFFRVEIGVACAIGAIIEAPLVRARVAGAALAVAVATLGPFVALLGGDMLPQTVGFVDEQRLQRLPFPLRPHVGFDPNKLLEFWMPLILVAGCAAWVLLSRRRWAFVPLALVGLAYLLARTDVYHLVPLSVALAVLLACAAAAARGARRAARADRDPRPRAPGREDRPSARAGRRAGRGRRRRANRGCRRAGAARARPVRPRARAARRTGLRREPALRPCPCGRPAAQRHPRPPEPDPLRRDAARHRHDRQGAARDDP
jgi:hypothetical protein